MLVEQDPQSSAVSVAPVMVDDQVEAENIEQLQSMYLSESTNHIADGDFLNFFL